VHTLRDTHLTVGVSVNTEIMNTLKNILLVTTIGLLPSCESSKKHEIVISNVNIIDVATGEIDTNQSVAIDGDTISAIYKKPPSFSDSTKIIDGTGKYLIPGLWDMHAHYHQTYKETNSLWIANGVTGLREMWGNMNVISAVRRGTSDGSFDAPNIYAGSIIMDGDPPEWPGTISVGNAEEARKAALQQIESGVDFLKVYSVLSKASFDAIAEVANEKGIPFAGHIPDEVTIQHAAKMGMRSTEHFIGVLMGAVTKRDSLLSEGVYEFFNYDLMFDLFDEKEFDSLCELLIKEDMWVCPTLVWLKGVAHQADEEYLNDNRLAYLHDYITDSWFPRAEQLSDEHFQKSLQLDKDYFDFILPLIGKMQKKGVSFLAGTDYSNVFCFPGFSLHDELSLMAEGGMDNLSALQTATINPAIFMGKEEKFGTIAEGKTASLLLLNKNPLEDITHTKTIEAVFLRGKVFNRSELDRMLDEVKRKVRSPKYSEWIEKSLRINGLEVTVDSLDRLLSNPNSRYILIERDLNSFGYKLLREGNLPAALKILEKNTQLFPESSNVYDSYGEALLKSEQQNESLKNYQKALMINPYLDNAQMMVDSIKHLIKKSR